MVYRKAVKDHKSNQGIEYECHKEKIHRTQGWKFTQPVLQKVNGCEKQKRNQQVGQFSGRPMQFVFLGANKVRLYDQHKAPQQQGYTMQMKSVVFLFE